MRKSERTEKGEGNAREIRPPTDAYGGVGAIDDHVGRSGDNAFSVPHYGAARPGGVTEAQPPKVKERQECAVGSFVAGGLSVTSTSLR